MPLMDDDIDPNDKTTTVLDLVQESAKDLTAQQMIKNLNTFNSNVSLSGEQLSN